MYSELTTTLNLSQSCCRIDGFRLSGDDCAVCRGRCREVGEAGIPLLLRAGAAAVAEGALYHSLSHPTTSQPVSH